MKKQQVLDWMEQNTSANPLLLGALSLLFVFLLIRLKKAGSKKYKLPPSPPKLPFIGNLHQLGRPPHHILWSLSKKYGPMMLLHLGRVPTLVVSSADGARDVMKTYDHIFSSRPLVSLSKRLLYGKDMIFSPYGEYWRQLRKICVLQLLSIKKVQSFRFVREQEVGLTMEAIHANHLSSKTVNLKEIFLALTNNVVSRVALGKKYTEAAGEGEGRVKAMLCELTYLMGVSNVADFIPSLAWVNHLNGLNVRVEKNFKDIDSFLDEVIEEHIETRRSHDDGVIREEDFVDVMLGIGEDPTFGMQLDRDHIKAIILDMFSAATDTSAVVMEWAMSEIIAHPEIMEEVQREVRGISKGKLILSETDTENMLYLKSIIKETLRLHPPAPLLVPHASIEDVQIQGYDIPSNASVFINVYAIGRDPMLWEEPESFKPKRFLNGGSMSSIDFKGQDFQLIPFGAGRRGCPGMFFATSIIELTLANLLNKFDWTLPNGMGVNDLDMEEGSAYTISRKNDLILAAKPHLF